jgi:hypothetical protein
MDGQPMILRLTLVIVLLGAGYLATGVIERRRGRVPDGLAPGLTVFTGTACRLCAPALSALAARGECPTVLDASAAPSSLGPIRALPLAILVSAEGEVLMRRAGRSVITDAAELASATTRARRLTTVQNMRRP